MKLEVTQLSQLSKPHNKTECSQKELKIYIKKNISVKWQASEACQGGLVISISNWCASTVTNMGLDPAPHLTTCLTLVSASHSYFCACF